MCSLYFPCGFQAQLILPSPSNFYLFKDNLGLEETIWTGYLMDNA